MRGKAKKIVIGLLLIAIVTSAYLLINTNRAMVAEPEAFCFSIEGIEHDYDMYYLIDAISFDPDILPQNPNWDKDARHLFVSADYLDNEWNYVYITGSYWYSPFKPTITVNNHEIAKVRTDLSSGDMKKYHFYLYSIKENEQYTITVRCGDARERIKVVFHAE